VTSEPNRARDARAPAATHHRIGLLAGRVADLFRPRVTLGARLVALDDAGRVCLVRHSYLPGLHLPGGAVDPGETCRLAAEREAREEGGLVLDVPPRLFHVYWGTAGGRQDHIVLFVARGARQPTPKRASLEILSAAFHPPDDLPAGVTPATRRRLAEVLEGVPPSDVW
jgi:8-oxo-dGTP pyrophosphatase MutT (NUDIX family)